MSDEPQILIEPGIPELIDTYCNGVSIQGYMDGGQARKCFQHYNDKYSSNIIDMSREYNTGDKYSNRRGTGNQIDKAFQEINAHLGKSIFTVNNPDYTNGRQLKAKFLKLLLIIANEAPVWATIPNQQMNQGDVWPITDLNDLCFGNGVISYTVTTGILPTGITLNTDGTFSGTATNSGAGTVAFTATDTNGSTESNWIDWNVHNVVLANKSLDIDNDGKPDTLLIETDSIIITEDEDSINIDNNKDGIADIISNK